MILLGIAVGRLVKISLSEGILGRVIFASILFLLFLLGSQIGANASLFADLPVIGWQAFLLMLFCVTGSILIVKMAARILAKLGLGFNGKDAR